MVTKYYPRSVEECIAEQYNGCSMEAEAAAIASVTGGRARVGLSMAGESSGRGLFATCAVAAGELVFSEPAFVASPAPFGCWECVCHTCLRREQDEENLLRCEGCRWAHWCSDACRQAGTAQAAHGSTRHSTAAHCPAECAAMAAMRYRQLDLPPSVLLAARLLRGSASSPQAGLAATLVGPSADTPEKALQELRDLAPTALALAGRAATDETQGSALTTLCQLRRNEFRVLDDRQVVVGCALYPAAARLNHSCAPNLMASSGDGWLLNIEAQRPIAAGEELLFSYVDAQRARGERAATLREQYLFTCGCSCADCATEHSTVFIE